MIEGESHTTEMVDRSFPTGFRRQWFQDERVWGVFLLLKQMEVDDVCGVKNLFFFWVPCLSHWFPHSVLTLVGGGEQIFLLSSSFAVSLEDHTKQQVLLLVMLCTEAFSWYWTPYYKAQSHHSYNRHGLRDLPVHTNTFTSIHRCKIVGSYHVM